MFMLAPLMEAEQDRPIRIENLAEVRVARWHQGLAEQRLVPSDTTRHVSDADDRPNAFHAGNLTRTPRSAPACPARLSAGVLGATDSKDADSGSIETASSRDRLHARFRLGRGRNRN